MFWSKKNHPTEQTIYDEYRHKNCSIVLKEKFPNQAPKQEELDFPIAYTLQVYRSAPLLERLLRRIYMPHNVYCIHIDKKSSDEFRRAVIEIIRCLPNVFVTRKDVDVIYFHISILQAQLNCMMDLLQSSIKWKYLVNLVGQDMPLYRNIEIVEALKRLNGFNNIESQDMPPKHLNRIAHVYEFQKISKGLWHSAYKYKRISRRSLPPPNNITIYKGSTLAALTREFCLYSHHSELAKNLLNWLKHVLAPEECFYASLQRIPGVPGGYHGEQHEWIMRAIRWYVWPSPPDCYGRWMRDVCVLSFGDLRWVMGRDMRTKLFAQKVPFDFDERFFDCVDLATEKRKYGDVMYE